MNVYEKRGFLSAFRLKPGRHVLWAVPLCVLPVLLNTAGCRNRGESAQEEAAVENVSPGRVVGIGRIEPELRFLDLSSETTGIASKINFVPGDLVPAGEVIVELSTLVEKARVDLAAARIRSQRSRIDAAKAALSADRVRAENARSTFERAKKLYEEKTESEAAYDAARAEYEALLEDIKRLEAESVSAENGLKESLAELKLAQAELERRFIKAPTDGRLLSLDITLGSLISPEKEFATFAPESPLVARCEIDELFASLVRPGQKASVRNQGTTENLARGEVTFVGPALRRKSLFSDDVGDLEDRRVREVWIKLDSGSDLLYGSRIECVIAIRD